MEDCEDLEGRHGVNDLGRGNIRKNPGEKRNPEKGISVVGWKYCGLDKSRVVFRSRFSEDWDCSLIVMDRTVSVAGLWRILANNDMIGLEMY